MSTEIKSSSHALNNSRLTRKVMPVPRNNILPISRSGHARASGKRLLIRIYTSLYLDTLRNISGAKLINGLWNVR